MRSQNSGKTKDASVRARSRWVACFRASARKHVRCPNYPSQQDGMNASAESHPAVDFDDRHACIKLISKRWIIIDIDAKRAQAHVAEASRSASSHKWHPRRV